MEDKKLYTIRDMHDAFDEGVATGAYVDGDEGTPFTFKDHMVINHNIVFPSEYRLEFTTIVDGQQMHGDKIITCNTYTDAFVLASVFIKSLDIIPTYITLEKLEDD